MSQIKVNALVSYSGNTVTLGTSGDTINVASGVTFNLPSTINVTTVVLAAGAVGTPSLTTSGDTNTGIFFSTADTIDFAEGGVATGQFDSSGNFKFNSGYGSVATAFGCRAWVNFNGTGTPAIREDGNITSITDIGTGKYEVNFTTALTDANYSVIASSNAGETYIFADSTGTSSLIRIATTNSGGSVVDTSFICVAVFR